MSEQPPVDMLRQGGNAAMQSLNQVATQVKAPGAQSAAAPAMPGGPLPAPDASAAIPSDVAGSADQAMAQRDSTAATTKQSAADVETVRQTVDQVAAAPVLFTAGRGDTAREQRRAAATEMVSTFLGTVSDRAHQILDLGAQVPNRLLGAASHSVGAIAATVEGRTRSVSAQIAQLRAKARGEAQAAQGVVASQHASASANITQATSAARQQLMSQYNATLQAIGVRATAQLRVIDDRYRQGDERFRNAGRVVGEEAVRRGGQMAADYMLGLKDEDDDFWDGPLTYNRGKARADTAREISAAYQKGLVEEANKQADQAQQGKGRDVEAVHTTARQAREALQNQYNATLNTLANAEATALRQASEARTQLNNSIGTALRGGEQALASHEVALIENLRAGARTQAAGVEQQAHEQVGAMQKQIGQIAAGIVEMGAIVADQVQGPPPPLPELATALTQANAEMDTGVGQVHAQIDQGQTATSEQITQAGQTVSERLTSASEAGMTGPTQAASQIGASLTSLGRSSVQTLSSIHQSHARTTAATVTATLEGFTRAVDGVQHSYDEMSKGLEQGFSQNTTALEQGLRGALPKMESEIRAKAEESASHVAPRWQSIVKWVLIIAVIVVVALVIGPFVIGAVGAALGTGAVMTGIIAGAIVGAATSATIQVINNWAENKPLLEGVGKAALIGAIGGAVGGGLGAWVGQLGQQGVAIANTAFRQFALNTVANVVVETGINLATGSLTWETFGMSVLSALAVGGALHAASGLKPASGLQKGAMKLGEGFGGSIRTGLNLPPTPIRYRPTETGATTRPPTEETPAGGTTRPPVEETPPGGTRPPTEEAPSGGTTRPPVEETPPGGGTAPTEAPRGPGTAPIEETPPGTTRPPTEESTPSGGAREERIRVIRQDDDFEALLNRKGNMKSHLTEDGSLAPANPGGDTTPLEHVYGMEPAKSESPYTSFLTEEGGVAKTYGAQEMELDIVRLEADIAAGRVENVSITHPEDLAGMIRAEIDAIAPVDPAVALARGPAGIPEYVESLGLSRGQSQRLSRRLLAYYNTTRDGEYLVRGVIPARYLHGPTSTGPPGGSGGPPSSPSPPPGSGR